MRSLFSAGLILALLLLFSTATTLPAEDNYIEDIVQHECTKVRTAGSGGMKQYTQWKNKTLSESIAEYKSARKEVLSLSKEWIETSKVLTKKWNEFKTIKDNQKIIWSAAVEFDQFRLLALETAKEKSKLEKMQEKMIDKAKQQALQKDIDALETKSTHLLEKTSNILKAQKYQEALSYMGFNRAFISNIFLPKDPSKRYKILSNHVSKKENQLHEELKKMEKNKSNLKKKFLKAREEYQDAYTLMKTIRLIYQGVDQCVSESPNSSGTLTAYWLSKGKLGRNGIESYCTSGQIRINFDDTGTAVDGILTTDCNILLYADGRRVFMCPPPPDMSPDITSNDIQSNLASGRIKARFKHEKNTDFATLTGTFQRSGDKPPYTYNGSGTFHGPVSKDYPPEKWIWQSDPLLRCQ